MVNPDILQTSHIAFLLVAICKGWFILQTAVMLVPKPPDIPWFPWLLLFWAQFWHISKLQE